MAKETLTISLDLRFAHLPGGGRVYVQNLAPVLVSTHPQVRWRLYHNRFCPHQQQIIQQLRNSLAQQNQPDNLELHPVGSKCLSLKQHLEFLRFHDDADLYHYLHFDLPLGMRHLPLVVTIHDLYPLTVPNYCSTAKRAYFSRMARSSARRAAAVIAISQHTKNDIVRLLDVPPQKISVVPQSHSPAYQPIDDHESLDLVRKKYQLPEKFIFYTGNHKLHKNLARLIKAYAQLATARQKEFPLILTGQIDAEAQELLTLAEKLQIKKSVTFIGWADQVDLPGLYNLCSLAVSPSYYEGFGFLPLEAMACGKPVVCSNATAIPEVVGSVARLFDPVSVEQITAALQEALENDVDNPQLKQSALAQAAKFSVQKTADETFQVYQKVINQT